jgi:ketosteroid isomerase-like protein
LTHDQGGRVSENSDALKRGYEAFNNGDAETLKEIFAEDVRWEGPNTEGLPMSGTHEGAEDVLQALGAIGESFETFRASPDEMVEEGETIVVLSHLEGKSKSGNEIKLPGVEVWRMSGGKAKRVQSLVDTAEMKKAIES